jgi:hypothetical protein
MGSQCGCITQQPKKTAGAAQCVTTQKRDSLKRHVPLLVALYLGFSGCATDNKRLDSTTQCAADFDRFCSFQNTPRHLKAVVYAHWLSVDVALLRKLHRSELVHGSVVSEDSTTPPPPPDPHPAMYKGGE